MLDKNEHIKKLERKIHNQRVALRENWMIIEQRMDHRPTPLRSMWWELVKKQGKEIKRLKAELEKKSNN